MASVDTWEASLCSRGCGFYGTPWTSGMCSKCYQERDSIYLKLLAAPLPTVDGSAPKMLWSQRATSVRIKIKLDGAGDITAGFDAADRISFQMTSQGKHVSVRAMPLFATCVPAQSRIKHDQCTITMILIKQRRMWWDALCKDKSYTSHVSVDVPDWRDEEDSDYEDSEGAPATSSLAGGAVLARRNDDDEDHPRFQMWEQVKMMEQRGTKRPLSAVFDPIDGSRDSPLPPGAYTEFRKASSTVCLCDKWVGHNLFLRYLEEMDAAFRNEPSRRGHLADDANFDELAKAIVQRAYRLSNADDACHQFSVVPQDRQTFMQLPSSTQRPYNMLRELRETVNQQGKVQLAYALQLLLKHENPDGLVAKLSEMTDRVPRCNSAKKQAFNMIIRHAFRSRNHADELAAGKSSCIKDFSGNSSADARAHAQRCFEDYLDDHKERAFSSTFIEPSRLYFHSIGDALGFETVRQHGINWYLVLLHVGLGMSVPFLPDYNDQFEVGTADVRQGLEPEAWKAFAEPVTFGMDFQGMTRFRGVEFGSGQFVQDPSLSSEFPRGVQTRYPRNLALVLADDQSAECESLRRALAPYLERYAHFFSRDFFVTKAIEALNAELKPEHAGFRKAFASVYQDFKQELGLSEANVDEYCYKDEYFTQLDVAKTAALFTWLGFVKPAKVAETCQICYEEKSDVDILDHWESVGDISDHRMCAACRDAYGKNECPFCKEVLFKEEFVGFIAEFTSNLKRNAIAQQQVVSMRELVAVATRSAQMLERWQLFEMEHEGNTRVVRRVAKLVIEGIAGDLRCAAKSRSDWLRDVAGVVLRLFAMIKETEVDVSKEDAEAFAAAVEATLAPYEQSRPVDYGIGPMEGHFYGHLYNQVLVAWLCAYRSGAADSVLRKLVVRAGRAIVRCLVWHEADGDKQGIQGFAAEVMHVEYIKQSHEPCWGSREDDLVWRTCFSGDANRESQFTISI